ncbi:MAG: phosphomevalonate kinase [Bdellovibrionales bacterium]|nr:phosphomevalonate kinase [Bdellovibrionales bacterium]
MYVQLSVPGKLFISGEWSILEVGNKGLVAAVNKRAHVLIEKNNEKKFIFHAKNLGINERATLSSGKILFDNPDSESAKVLSFAKSAVEACLKYFKTLPPMTITTWSDDFNFVINNQTRKLGFGSSAAVVVGIVAGIFRLMEESITDPKSLERIFKVSVAAHFLAQGKVGSGFDIAASTYGGLIVYSRFDPSWLLSEMLSGDFTGLVDSKWPALSIQSLNYPPQLKLLIAWSGESASTGDLIKNFNKWRAGDPSQAKIYLSEIANVASKAIQSLKKNDQSAFLDAIRFNRHLLSELGIVSGVKIETEALKKLADIAEVHGAAGKLSGAGGGDCGIALTYDDKVKSSIYSDWKSANIHPIDADISIDGILSGA